MHPKSSVFASSLLWASAGAVSLAVLSPAVHASDPWADHVVEYEPGIGGAASQNNPLSVLGEPTRFTSPSSPFGGPTTPFQSAFGDDEVLSLGAGGFVTVRFDQPFTNNPANPFGIDLLIFGNAFVFPTDGVTGIFAEGGVVEVSQNGVDWHLVPNVVADGAFPTLGYTDVTEPFPSQAGQVLTDFTKPVDPSFDLTGKTLAEIIAGYDGSGGGAGVDLASVNLDWASWVRVSNPVGSGMTPEIDGFAIVSVPTPATGMLLIAGALAAANRRRDLAQ